MKFSHTISLNANPDWAEHYIDYAGLKKVINEVQEYRGSAGEDGNVDPDPEWLQEERRDIFLGKVSKMVGRVREFYDRKKAELDVEMARLRPVLERSSSRMGLALLDESAPLVAPTPIRGNRPLRRNMVSVDGLARRGVDLEDRRREICDLFTQYHSLQQYADLNCTGVRKILKKYDKTLLDNLKETHLESLKLLLPFWDQNTPEIDSSKATLQSYFAHFFCNDDKEEALRQLKLMVREFISFQRHSVWLDVVQDQRANESATVSSPSLKLAKGTDENTASEVARLLTPNRIMGTVAAILFLAILYWPGPIFAEADEEDDPAQRNSLALFVFVSLLWAAEVLPLYVTSMLVPLLAVLLRVITVDGRRLDAVDASRHVFGHMFSHVIMLLLGGFSVAAALSKHNVAQVAASAVSRRYGADVRTVVLVNMLVATGASMWISNVAAPVLCYGLLSPILKASAAEASRVSFGTAQQRAAENDRRMCRALVLGVALASNVGGMASPISSPQNLFAIEYAPVGWLAWFTVSVPLCVLLDVLLWMWLVVCFGLPRGQESAAVQYSLKRDRNAAREPFTSEQWFVTIVSVGTVWLWCASVGLAPLTGQMGVLGIVPFALFFGSGLLTTQDLNSFLWSVVVLAMGGLALGEVVKTSGLLDVVARAIAAFIDQRSVGLWATLCIFCALILFCTTFVSHTVGAIVVIPIVQAIGSRMAPGTDKELVFASALACSAAMGLPVSGFPNMTAVSVEDRLGNRYLSTVDFLKYAVPASMISLGVIVTFGYWLIKLAVRIDGL